jgi:hypothetical protein
VADQVEGVEVLPQFLGDGIEWGTLRTPVPQGWPVCVPPPSSASLSEGEIAELHIGFTGTLYLKNLGEKTWRRQSGRVRAGESGGGNCYGYDVVRGSEQRGRTMNPTLLAEFCDQYTRHLNKL